MKPDEIKQLLGGYATGTLTPQEQRALFDAALEDQDLFDALAREQALKEAFDEPAIRRELLDVLESNASVRSRFAGWLRWPYPLASASALGLAAVMVIVLVRSSGPTTPASEKVTPMAAQLRAPLEPAPPSPEQKVEAPRAKLERSTRSKAIPSNHEKMPARLDAHKQSVPESVALSAHVEVPSSIPATPPPAASPAAEIAHTRALEAENLAVQSASGARTSFAAADAQTAGAARDLFNGTPSQPSQFLLNRGVVGGVPGAAMAPQARAAKTTAEGALQARSTIATPFLGVRYSERQSQGSPTQLVVESNADAVLYIFRRNDAGQWLPVTEGGMSLKAHTPATTAAIAVSGNAPAPRAVLVLSRSPLPQLAMSGADLTAEIEKLRTQHQATPLLSQIDSGSTYLVNPRPATIIVTPLAVP